MTLSPSWPKRSDESLASWIASLPQDERTQRLSELAATPAEQATLEYLWPFWARPKQLTPASWEWQFWLILAGRGFGQTRCGAEWVREKVGDPDRRSDIRIALVGRSAPDVRKVMVEGDSGLLKICPPWNRPKWNPSTRTLRWPNGAQATTYSADEPDQLRGPQHHYAWADELAAWRYEDSWDQLKFGLRLGSNPQCIITTTPRPTKIVRALLEDARDRIDAKTGRKHRRSVEVTRGSTYENKANLAPTFLREIVSKYEGTRLGRQELHAEVLDDTPGALWRRDPLDEHRIGRRPSKLVRIGIGVDPATTSGENSDETGIVVAGLDENGIGYVLEDASGKYTPAEWAAKVVELFDRWEADFVVAEVNQGGDMVESTLRTVRRSLPIRKVRASRAKRTRAEPVAALYEQKRVHHLGSLIELEDQMCTWVPGVSTVSPDRMDALVWILTELMVDADPNPKHSGSGGLHMYESPMAGGF